MRLNPALEVYNLAEEESKFSRGRRRNAARELQGGSNQPPAREEPCEASPEKLTMEIAWMSKQGATRKEEKERMLEKRPGHESTEHALETIRSLV